METGRKIGRYEIRGKVGEGGMGEVYLAFDEQLDRDVVLKILLPKFANDENLVKRFKLEARAVSALNHPNIITIYEIIETENLLCIVYEFIKGTTLREKIRRNQLSISRSVKIVEQIASGLAAAHQAGIIHRDIKPENIMIRDDGYVKILDFGLAKRSVFETDSESQTAQLVKTREGVIMGSVYYMSPEQTRGEQMDGRTDIWSLGVVFYEMLTGKTPFAAESISDCIAHILRNEPPPPSRFNQQISSNLDKIVEKTLKKNRDERYQKIENLLSDLNDLELQTQTNRNDNETLQMPRTTFANEPDISTANTLVDETRPIENFQTAGQQQATVQTTKKKNYWRWAAIVAIPLVLFAVAIVALAGAGVWYYYSTRKPEIAFKNIQVEPLTKDKNADLVSLTDDGKTLAFVRDFSGNPKLSIRQMETGNEIDLFKPEKGTITSVKISGDGNWIYYVLEESGDGKLYRIPALGGTSEKLGENIHSGITFSPDEKMFAFLRLNASENIARVFVVNTDGTNLKELVSSKDIGYSSLLDLDWSPDGKQIFLAALGKADDAEQTVSVGTVDIDTSKEPMSTKQFKVLNNEGWRVIQSSQWLNDGSGVLFIGGKSADKTKQIYHLSVPKGQITRITNDTSNYSTLDVSDDAKILVASTANIVSSLWNIDAETKKANQISPETETLLNFVDISESEDGRIFYSKLDGNEVNIYSINSDGKDVKQITSRGWNMGAQITPDNKYILTTGKSEDGYNGVLRLDLDGKNPIFLTKIKNKMDMMPQFSPDGTIVFVRLGLDWSFPKLMKVSVNGGEVSNIFNDDQKLEIYPSVSPDGKYLAFVNFFADSVANSVKMKMKVVEFSDGSAGKTVLEKDIQQVTRFDWSNDGRDLIYLEPNKKMNLLKISLSDKSESALTDFTSRVMEGAFTFSRDGKKIFAVRSSDSRELVLIKNVTQN